MKHQRGIVIKFEVGYVVSLVAALGDPIYLWAKSFVEFVIVELSARNNSKVGQTFFYPYQNVCDDV